MPSWLLLMLLVLTTYRLTRLSVRDELPLVKIPRDAVCNWLDPRDEHGQPAGQAPLGGLGRAAAYGIECDWCSSVWWAAALTLAADVAVGLPAPWLMFGATAAAAALLADAELRAAQRHQLAGLQMQDLRHDLRRRGAQGV